MYYSHVFLRALNGVHSVIFHPLLSSHTYTHTHTGRPQAHICLPRWEERGGTRKWRHTHTQKPKLHTQSESDVCVLQERDFTLAVPPNCNHWSGDPIVDHIFSHPIIREGEIDTARSLSYTVMFCMACVCDFYTSLFRETTTHMVELNRISRAFAKPKPVCGYINAMSHRRRLLNKKNKCFQHSFLGYSILYTEFLRDSSICHTNKKAT